MNFKIAENLNALYQFTLNQGPIKKGYLQNFVENLIYT